MSELKELFRLRTAVAAEAVKNPDFMELVKSDPNKALSEFTGVDYSAVKINIVEEDGDTITFPIPKIDGDLDADQLEAVAGGALFGITITAAGVGTAASCVTAGATATGAAYGAGKGFGWW